MTSPSGSSNEPYPSTLTTPAHLDLPTADAQASGHRRVRPRRDTRFIGRILRGATRELRHARSSSLSSPSEAIYDGEQDTLCPVSSSIEAARPPVQPALTSGVAGQAGSGAADL